MVKTPADTYELPDDLALVTCYFNSHGYQSKRACFDGFIRRFRGWSREQLYVVECAFGDAPFTLPDAVVSRRLRAADMMWQKERLLNLAVEALPSRWTKVAWLDADLLFCDPRWAVHTSAALDTYPVVQPFQWVVRLPRGVDAHLGDDDGVESFGSGHHHDPQFIERPQPGIQWSHRHPGFAWAARRALLDRHGLYDKRVLGGADHIIAHAMCGDWRSTCATHEVGPDTLAMNDFLAWATEFHRDVRGRVAYVPGTLLSLWHGSQVNRSHVGRHEKLRELQFHPAEDLRLSESGCWEWTARGSRFRRWAERYLASRREDDD